MKIALFDWTVEGHHSRYVRRFSEVLGPRANLIVAVPEEISPEVSDLPVKYFPLGSKRPRPDSSQSLSDQNRELAITEVDLFERVVEEVRPDHIIHMCADPIIRRMVYRPTYNVPVTLCIFHPRAHYFASYRSLLPPGELMRAWFQEYLVMRWRQRLDAYAIFTLDQEAVRRWSLRKGAPAFYLPEPPLEAIADLPAFRERSGCIIYGYLFAQKGIGRLRRAVAQCPSPIRVILAGNADPTYQPALMSHVSAMHGSGATIDLRCWQHNEHEGLAALAEARCAVLPYIRHYGMSRVLLEASVAGTPVIAHNFGLLGHLVEKHGIGEVVDCSNPRAFSKVLNKFCSDEGLIQSYSNSLSRFADNFSRSVFERAILAPWPELSY